MTRVSRHPPFTSLVKARLVSQESIWISCSSLRSTLSTLNTPIAVYILLLLLAFFRRIRIQWLTRIKAHLLDDS